MKLKLTLFLLLIFSNLSAEFSIIELQSTKINESTGSAVLQLTGNTGPFSVTLKNESGDIVEPYNNDPVEGNIYGLSNLEAGSYIIEIIDAEGCVTEMSFEIVESCLFDVSLKELKHVSACIYPELQAIFGVYCDYDGILDLNLAGDYTVTWKGKTIVGDYSGAGNRIENLAPGSYTATISDINGCVVSRKYEIMDCFPTYFASLDVELIEISGIEDIERCNGKIVLSVDNTNDQAYYYWTNQSGERISESLYITELCLGSYTFHLDNGCGEVYTRTFEIPLCDESEEIILSLDKTDVSVGSDRVLGSISSSVMNYSGEVKYLWSNGSTDAHLENLGLGTYSLTVTDACGRIGTESITLSDCLNSPFEIVIDNACFDRFQFNTTEFHINIIDENNFEGAYEITWWNEDKTIIERICDLDFPANCISISGDEDEAKDLPLPDHFGEFKKEVTIKDLNTGCEWVVSAQFQRHQHIDGFASLGRGYLTAEETVVDPAEEVLIGCRTCKFCLGNCEKPFHKADFKPFQFIPFNIHEPCTSGGYLMPIYCVDVIEPIYIAPAVEGTVSQLSSFQYLYGDDDYICDESIGCLFSRVDAFDFPSDRPVFFQVCPNREIPEEIFMEECNKIKDEWGVNDCDCDERVLVEHACYDGLTCKKEGFPDVFLGYKFRASVKICNTVEPGVEGCEAVYYCAISNDILAPEILNGAGYTTFELCDGLNNYPRCVDVGVLGN